MQQHGSKYFFPSSHIPLTLWVGSKGQNSTFSEHVMLHIKLNGITNAATW